MDEQILDDRGSRERMLAWLVRDLINAANAYLRTASLVDRLALQSSLKIAGDNYDN